MKITAIAILLLAACGCSAPDFGTPCSRTVNVIQAINEHTTSLEQPHKTILRSDDSKFVQIVSGSHTYYMFLGISRAKIDYTHHGKWPYIRNIKIIEVIEQEKPGR